MISFDEFVADFNRLRDRSVGGAAVRPAVTLGAHHAVLSPDDKPALYVSCADEPLLAQDVRTTWMTVRFVGRCEVRVGGRPKEADFLRAACHSDEETVQRSFLLAAWAMAEALPPTPTYEQAIGTVRGMVALFERLVKPPRKEPQGLWAELFVIAQATKPASMCAAWREDPDHRFDFDFGATKLEVKSSSSGTREHHFSLGQVEVPKSERVLVASLMTMATVEGTSIGDLAARIRAALGADAQARIRFDAALMATAGNSYEEFMDRAYDDELARTSLGVYRGEEVPRPSVAPGDPVRQVQFVSDLSQLTALSRRDVRAAISPW